jgi:hypothetical protein
MRWYNVKLAQADQHDIVRCLRTVREADECVQLLNTLKEQPELSPEAIRAVILTLRFNEYGKMRGTWNPGVTKPGSANGNDVVRAAGQVLIKFGPQLKGEALAVAIKEIIDWTAQTQSACEYIKLLGPENAQLAMHELSALRSYYSGVTKNFSYNWAAIGSPDKESDSRPIYLKSWVSDQSGQVGMVTRLEGGIASVQTYDGSFQAPVTALRPASIPSWGFLWVYNRHPYMPGDIVVYPRAPEYELLVISTSDEDDHAFYDNRRIQVVPLSDQTKREMVDPHKVVFKRKHSAQPARSQHDNEG